ncbi:MAG: hypothetical protein U0640_07005 [Phycisphaerales bacterium]
MRSAYFVAFVLVAGSVVGSAMSGCTAAGNSRPEVGDARFGQSRSVLVRSMSDYNARPEEKFSSDSPSVSGLSRAHWQPTTVIVPVDGVEGYPRYTREHPQALATARQRGEYPTEMTALELSGDTYSQRWNEALESPAWAIWQAVSMPYRFIWVQPWEPTRHLPDQHWRAPVNTARITSAEMAASNQPEKIEDTTSQESLEAPR